MQLTMLAGYPDRVGKRFVWAGFGVGPTSYATGGDTVALPGFQNYIDAMFGDLTVSGTYYVRSIPSVAGPRATWKVKWFITSSGAEVTAGTNLSAETVMLSGLGGVY